MTADELWEKYSTAYMGGNVLMDKTEFLAAIAERDAYVKAECVRVCSSKADEVFNANPGRKKGTVSGVGGYAGHLLKDCAAAIERMPLP